MTEQQEAIQNAVTFFQAEQAEFLERFKALLRIPCISTDPAYKADVLRAAEWLVDEMARIGLRNAQVLPSEGHPVAYGEWLEAGPNRPTLLIYAHYDAQPVGPMELWESPPFEPTIRDGKLYARGVIDDKAGVYLNLKALEAILGSAGKLPLNVKVFFEGEEEAGSPSMGSFIAEHKKLLAADLLLVSDGGPLPDQPLCAMSTRGIVAGDVVITGPKRDLHSGSFGGIVHNPAHMVGEIIAAFHDEAGRIQIPGYYDDVRQAAPEALEQLKPWEPIAIPSFQEKSGVTKFWGVPEYSLLERATLQPTLDVTGVYGGYTGEGQMTIIPAMAGFKASMRIVPNQDPDDIAQKFRDYVLSFDCPTLDIQVEIVDRSHPAELLGQGPAVEALQRAYEATWGQRAVLFRHGGSIPVLGMLHSELGIPMLDFGLGVGDNGHAPNEYMLLDHFGLGIERAIHLYHYLAQGKLD
jgi:acetylornithine deacetylase/succinyl-diaminopimelate desuccinylase-like protein